MSRCQSPDQDDDIQSPPQDWDFFENNEISTHGISQESVEHVYEEIATRYTARSTPAHPRSTDLSESLDENACQISKALGELADADDCPVDVEKWTDSNRVRWEIDYSPAIPDGGISDLFDVSKLNKHQYELLYVTAQVGPMIGADLMDEYGDHVGHGISPGQFYPDMNSLAELGLIEKQRSTDARSFTWSITTEAREKLRQDAQWRCVIAEDLGGEQA